MPMPPAVRAIRHAMAQNDLDLMRNALALGENYAMALEADAVREATHPPPPPAEGEPERVSATALLADVTSALGDLRRAIGRAEREHREKKSAG